MAANVAIRRCADYDRDNVHRAVGEAIAAVVDLPTLVRDKRVFIKVNFLSDAPPESAVCTHPEIARALIRWCLEAGAAEVAVGDMPGMHLTDRPELPFERSGLAPVCREEGARVAPLSGRGYREVEVPGARRLHHLMFACELLDADVVINAPKLKSHIQALYTGAIKNWFGAIANRDRKRSHHFTELEPFSECVVDIFRVRPPDLTVMDGVIGMEGSGPQEGDPRQLGLVLASTDAVALDTVSMECVDYSRMKVPQVRIAAEEGLGEADLSKITIDGPPFDEVRQRFATPPTAFVTMPKFMTKLAFRFWRIRPEILADKCQVCGACERMCPVGAISMTPECAVIDYTNCIECFCCHESCPHRAIGEDMTLLYRLHRYIAERKQRRTAIQK
ncbi:MAG: DUF362 domain-containing protein [Candidatus Lernaella stagnicola]|nr:DUF362 domain-containing protein [Candidatus Lernaella stagnicola]